MGLCRSSNSFGKIHEVRFDMTQQLEVDQLDYYQHFLIWR
jgi:hypothetical protein